jgi:hypothetical protein
MAYDPNDSGEYIRPLPQYMDNLIVEHPELGQCELWKAIAWDTARLRNYKLKRADSAGAIAEQAAGRTAEAPPRPTPLVADADDGDDPVTQRILAAISDLEGRLDRFEQRKAEEAECARRAEAALALAERLAEEAPSELMDALSTPKQMLH